MRIISLPRSRWTWRLLCLGTALCLGVVAWVAAQPAETPRSIQRTARPPGSKHFSGTVHFDVLAKLLEDDRRSAPGDDWLRELADPKAPFRVETQGHPLLHRAAADFTLQDHRGRPWCLQEECSRSPVVLVFYLGYGCNACVHDLFELNGDLSRFRRLGAEVVGVSGDAPDFTRRQTERYGGFGFALLSDPGHAAAQSYGAFRSAKGSEPEELLHATFLIGRDGLIHWVHRGDTPFRNNKALLYELAHLEKPP
jgi:mycoredoxin-dependent peroxiredoxin